MPKGVQEVSPNILHFSPPFQQKLRIAHRHNGHEQNGKPWGGMDMGSDGMFKTTNMYIARVYWYLVVAFVVLLGLWRGID